MSKMTEALRHNISLLERSTKPQRPANEEQIVSTYTKRDGSRWNKVRTGWNTYTHRQVA